MGSSLQAAVAITTLDAEEEAALMEPVNLFSSPNQWNHFHNDVHGSMSCACKERLTCSNHVTNDHKFFTKFLKSRVAGDTLHSNVTDVLGIQKGVCVKLDAELIHGL